MLPYLTLEVMGLGMKHRKERLHVQEMRQLWTLLCDPLEIWPELATHVHAEEFNVPAGQLVLQVQRVRIYFPSGHIKCAMQHSMPANSQLQPLLINIAAGLLRGLPGC